MHALKSIRSLLHDDANQMDYRIAALHALIKACPLNNITSHQFSFSVFCGDGRLRFANQRSHGMAFRNQSTEYVLAHKPRRTSKKDFHWFIVDALNMPLSANSEHQHKIRSPS